MATVFVRDGDDVIANMTTTGDQERPDVTVLADGSIVVVWMDAALDGSGPGIFIQRFAADGTPLGAEMKVNSFVTGAQRLPVVAAIDGGFVIVWDSDGQDGASYGIYMQRYDLGGVAQGAETRVNATTASTQYHAAIIGLADGGFVVAWESAQAGTLDIYFQRFDADGVPQGGEIRANATTPGIQTSSEVAALADGGFVITWASNDADNQGVYFQRYNASGVAQGVETCANATETGIQAAATAAGLSGGGFVVAWYSNQPGADGFDSYFQLYAADGTASGGEVRANTILSGNQAFPDITATVDGGFVIAWHGAGGTDVTLSARAFDASGVAQGDQFSIDGSPAGSNTDVALAATPGGFVAVSTVAGDGNGMASRCRSMSWRYRLR